MRWQVKAVRSGRIGIWRRNRHRTVRSISASVGDQNGTSHGPLWEAGRAAAVQPTRLGHPRFLDAVGAQTTDFNEVRSPKKPCHTWPHAVEFPIRLSIAAAASRSDRTTSAATVTLGKRISRDFYVAYERSLAGTLGTISIFYDLSRRFTLRASTGEQSAIDLIFTIRYD